MKRTTHRLAALAAVATFALTGCAGNDSGGDSGDQTAPSSQGQSTPGSEKDGASTATATDEGGGESSDQGSSGQGSSGQDSSETRTSASMEDPAGTHIARTAGLTLTVKDIERSSARVRSAATAAGGYVSSEETRLAGEDASGSWAEIVVTVPVDELDSTMTTLAEIGTVSHRTSDAEDLTQQYTDTRARVRTLTRSTERLRSLIDDTEDLDQVVTLEDELSQREADLESMVSQEKSLEKRTTTAPITVDLATPEAAEETEEDERTGFVAGLRRGWDGFTSAVTVALTALGAVTPFALTALVVLAPVLWWLRRRSGHAPTATPDLSER